MLRLNGKTYVRVEAGAILQPHGNVTQSLLHSGNVIAVRQIEHGRAHPYHFHLQSVAVDRQLHGSWKLELAARRQRHLTTRAENGAVEQPAIHAAGNLSTR